MAVLSITAVGFVILAFAAVQPGRKAAASITRLELAGS